MSLTYGMNNVYARTVPSATPDRTGNFCFMLGRGIAHGRSNQRRSASSKEEEVHKHLKEQLSRGQSGLMCPRRFVDRAGGLG